MKQTTIKAFILKIKSSYALLFITFTNKKLFLLQDETENLTSAPAKKTSEADSYQFLRTRKTLR